MEMNTAYHHPPLALEILAGIFLCAGALCALIVTGDIIVRRGWRSMMWIMIPVYIINATYMLPVTLFVYFKYGRPSKEEAKKDPAIDQAHNREIESADEKEGCPKNKEQLNNPTTSCSKTQEGSKEGLESESRTGSATSTGYAEKGEHNQPANNSHCHHHGKSRPMYATILVGVSHCGAGCVLGDIVGEWLVYGTGASINGQSIWVELLVDYAFALLFGILFQYFSIAPMSGEYGLRTVWRAAKADVLSLTSFEVGAFGWMVVYQVGIFGYRLSMTTWTYWWMMQMGMVLGFATAMPMNWWLIRKGIKEPCA